MTNRMTNGMNGTARASQQSAGLAANAQHDSQPAEYRYHLLRAAADKFSCGLAALADDQWPQVEARARQSFCLENLVLNAPEAQAVCIPEDQIEQALVEVRSRYADEAQFRDELALNGLDLAALRRALQRELTFDAVIRTVGARHAPVTEADEQLFYELHAKRFRQPETRSARHLLITVNEEFAENSRATARARLEALAEQIKPGDAATFGELARNHSECPSALQDGQLGTLTSGQLYPALDNALFEMVEGAISEVLESPLGFHLLYCEAISPAKTVPFEQARERIRQALTERRQGEMQKAWIAELRAQTGK
ncbi:nitrogen fixation protein NifM [Thiorhodovibrio frisius]|uniref:Nitrogen fixation protein NifM n=1 Tax=Thiorhodovibrio frisius TaxID=631362 RepID=H8Z747_9GAMM|nr:nitrogen fixation protein NifM [Thiorhodovibrio frisius]EIC20846.1 nitrogen fixation protein NifM [Thiorhodovibrio frisius]WPL21898.1 Foldase protein PrsA 2 precursor [Thiorhodovibrio frisius]